MSTFFSHRRRSGILATLTALLSGCSAPGLLNSLAAKDTFRANRGIAYGLHARHKLDLYHPVAAPAGRARPPLVVFFYGGNWRSGERGDYLFVAEALASRGAVVVIPDYRLHPEVRYPDFLHDSAAAVRWVFDHALKEAANPDRVYLMGHSAGAYNASMLALDRRWLGPLQQRLAGFVGLAGPYNFLPIVHPDTRLAFGWPDTPPESQPIAHVTRAAPPSLLLAASSDRLVDPARNSVALAERLRSAGVPVRVRLFAGVSHVTLIGALAPPLRPLAPVLSEVLEFLELGNSRS